jgi:DNA excision repair protein ERCC-2
LPSFEYLDLVADAYTSRHPDQLVLRQARGMSDESRAAFIEVLLGAGARVIAFAVLGGVFTESIDLPNDALHGIIVVGIGLPPPSLERNEMAQVFGTFGRMLAYEQPAMTRVVQAAGRLIRRATDRGVVCLIDDRFLSKDFRQYLPRHWQPVRTPARELSAALRAFWDAATV